MVKLYFLVVVRLEPDCFFELLQVLFDRPVGEVVGSVGVVESLVLPCLFSQTVMIIEAFFPAPRLAVALSKLSPALLDHFSCLQHAIKQISHSSTYIFRPNLHQSIPWLITSLYILMISSFKGVTSNNIASALSAFAGPKLNPEAAILQGLKLVTSPQKEYLECKFIYADFKQALRHLLQISRICRSLNYHPEIFNVYNRIEIKLCTPVENTKCVTAKDCYMAFFLEELHQKTIAKAHELALVRIQQLI